MASPRKMKQYAKSIHGCRQNLVVDSGAFRQLPEMLIEQGRRRVLLISGKQTQRLGLYDKFVARLKDLGAKCFVWSVDGNVPDHEIVEECARACTNYNCDAIVALGGGSIIDIAKMVSIWVRNADCSLYQMRGIGRIKQAGVPLYAVSSTGSGAESSACSILRHNHQISMYYSKYLVPGTVVLDSELLLRLPTDSMAQSMVYALAHAVEVYISPIGKAFQADRANALVAIPIFFSHLEKCYQHGANPDIYQQMMMAPYYSGVATRRIGFGYTHCLSMYIAEKYDLSPGKVSAAILPAILNYEFEEVKADLAELSHVAGLCSNHASVDEAAHAFISGFSSLCHQLGLQNALPQIRPDDCGEAVELALYDAEQWEHPKKLTQKVAMALLRKVQRADG